MYDFKMGFLYFSAFWNLIEFTKIIVGITAIIMYLTKTYYVKTSLTNLSAREGEFINFQRVAIWNEIFIYCVGFICFSSILYVINLLRFNVKMSALALVLKNSTEDLMSFSVIFFILFFAFASFAYVGKYTKHLLGLQNICFSFWSNYADLQWNHNYPRDYVWASSRLSKYVLAIRKVYSIILGDLDFSTMGEINGSIGTIYYFIFTTVMTFIVMNFFFTILGDGFAQTQEQLHQLHNQYEILAFLKGLLYVNIELVFL